MSDTINDISKVLVLVETEDGSVHQVLATHQQKKIALRFMKSEKRGCLMLSEEVEPFELEMKGQVKEGLI